jgi:hypothetical protein
VQALTIKSPRAKTVGPPPWSSFQNVGGGGGERGGRAGGNEGDVTEIVTPISCAGVTLSTRLLSAREPSEPKLISMGDVGRPWTKLITFS